MTAAVITVVGFFLLILWLFTDHDDDDGCA